MSLKLPEETYEKRTKQKSLSLSISHATQTCDFIISRAIDTHVTVSRWHAGSKLSNVIRLPLEILRVAFSTWCFKAYVLQTRDCSTYLPCLQDTAFLKKATCRSVLCADANCSIHSLNITFYYLAVSNLLIRDFRRSHVSGLFIFSVVIPIVSSDRWVH